MELGSIKNKIAEYIKKYKYLLLILLIGVVLMTMPGKTAETHAVQAEETSYNPSNDEAATLQNVLKKIEGAGRVEVMLTKAADSEYIYQSDDDTTSADSGVDSTKKTVIISNGSKSENGLIRKINAPVYRGALVVCDGGDNPSVRLAIVDAVSKVTGLGSNQIAVLKMD